ncbi:hypothetical protein E4656_06175 [Natronospirillum operosum]|uniref:Cellulose biosynthesis protein BcsS n=1 Tax=Natronospirillum operosum TaxID=2759953 RepID=A0A4Z0WKR7_9GAMM|nr:hypothetical protein [Natronospirillum operosum]TGG95981.1 hypothetical protein E4656_06175 [Natronospirillum operosum]
MLKTRHLFVLGRHRRPWPAVTFLTVLLASPVGANSLSTAFNEEGRWDPRLHLHGGVQVIDRPQRPEDLDAYYLELNSALSHRDLSAVSLLLDLRGESLTSVSGEDRSTGLFAHLRPGIGLTAPLTSNFHLYGEAKLNSTLEWYSLNGEQGEDYPAHYNTALYEVGFADNYRGAYWRLGMAWSGHAERADRQPWQLRGHVHVVDHWDESAWSWGVNGRLAPDYFSMGLSLSFF